MVHPVAVGAGRHRQVVIDPCNSGVCPGNAGGSGGVVVTDINVTAVPEPATYALIFGGMAVVGAMRRRQQA